MVGTIDKKRGIVNVPIYRNGRKTCASMDQALVMLGIDLFNGDGKALLRWIQECTDRLEAQLRQAALSGELGDQVIQASGFSRLIQREVIEMARERLAAMRSQQANEKGEKSAELCYPTTDSKQPQ